MPKVQCNKCFNDYEFKEQWFLKHNPDTFVCRKCKIRIKTQSNTYRKKQSVKSKAVLSDPNIKARMSQRATLNNIQNADKISQGVKRHYQDHDNLQKAKKRSREQWQNKDYRKLVSDGLKKKWRDPEYRGKILGSRTHLHKHNAKLEQLLTDLGYEFELGFIIAAYEFEALIEGKYLFDEEISNEKKMFIEHYFKNYTYTNNLDLIRRLES